ncbi:hypothetical protein ACN9MH_15280 [Paenibacillus silvae]|uniref:hypothetical protein n=1 Tax=Paenibacillus silvae TaxID=1325358 RepID=UPI003CF2667F
MKDDNLIKFFNGIDANAWIQTFGGILGALLAGMVAVIIFRNQVKFDTNKERIKEIENFLKSNVIITGWLKSSYESVNEIYKAIDSEILNIESKISVLRTEIRALQYCVGILDKIQDDYIPMEIYQKFVEMKTTLDLIEAHSSIQLEKYQLGQQDKYSNFEAMAERVDHFREVFEKYGEEKTKEHRKLKRAK